MSQRLFRGGADVPHRKQTEDCETRVMPVPAKVWIPMLQHIGVICEAQVAKGDLVKVGQILGNTDKPFSAPIHSSVSGKVTDISELLHPSGFRVPTIEIETDGLQTLCETVKPPVITDNSSFIAAVRASGLVGLGGAGFPAHIKLSPPPSKKIDYLLVNGAECEPYITSDYREILENSWDLICGINIILQYLGIPQCLIGIEDNKPQAIKVLKAIDGTSDKIKVVALPSRYPQGAEKMLIYSLTKKIIPSGKLPADVGVIVLNVNSITTLARYIKTGMPLIKKKVTVDGSAVTNPGNFEVLIGTRLSEVFAFAGGFSSEPGKVIMGGPMMGVAQHTLDTSVVKHTNALLAFEAAEARLPQASPCIRCLRCVKACPMGLLPHSLNRLSLSENTAGLKEQHVLDCIECGSCSFVCPSKIPLVQTLRLGKNLVRQAMAKGAS